MEKKVIQIGRIQSPSSIKTYKQCPRKYYYNYILELPTSPNIHQVRGNIAHSVLENFFDTDTTEIDLENYETKLKLVIQKLLLNEWKNYGKELEGLEMYQEETIHYFEDTLMMLLKWTDQFCQKIAKMDGNFQERFKSLTPMRELLMVSDEYHVQGFIDAIENHNGCVRVMDYKTSKRFEVDDHILQLAIYSLLYQEKHGKLPDKVGIYFLKGGEECIDADETLVEMAKQEVMHVHEHTCTDDVKDYPKKPSALCKYSTGQCEFYDVCRPFD